jgi:hypothetical protein
VQAAAVRLRRRSLGPVNHIRELPQKMNKKKGVCRPARSLRDAPQEALRPADQGGGGEERSSLSASPPAPPSPTRACAPPSPPRPSAPAAAALRRHRRRARRSADSCAPSARPSASARAPPPETRRIGEPRPAGVGSAARPWPDASWRYRRI